MFAEMIKDLLACRMTEQEIATAIGRSQAHVNRMRNGKHGLAGYDAVDKLRALHREKCPDKYLQETADAR